MTYSPLEIPWVESRTTRLFIKFIITLSLINRKALIMAIIPIITGITGVVALKLLLSFRINLIIALVILRPVLTGSGRLILITPGMDIARLTVIVIPMSARS
jgi:hypothetical protein